MKAFHVSLRDMASELLSLNLLGSSINFTRSYNLKICKVY